MSVCPWKTWLEMCRRVHACVLCIRVVQKRTIFNDKYLSAISMISIIRSTLIEFTNVKCHCTKNIKSIANSSKSIQTSFIGVTLICMSRCEYMRRVATTKNFHGRKIVITIWQRHTFSNWKRYRVTIEMILFELERLDFPPPTN